MILTLYTCTCMCMRIWYRELQNYSTKQDRNWRLKPNIYDAIWLHAFYKSQRVHYKITWLNVTYDVLYRIELLPILYNGIKLYATKLQRVYSGTCIIQTPSDRAKVSWILRCPGFPGWTSLCMYCFQVLNTTYDGQRKSMKGWSLHCDVHSGSTLEVAYF